MPSYKNLAVFRLCFLCSAFCFLNRVEFVRASFSALNIANIRIPLLLFQNSLAYCRAYFLHSKLGKHRNLLLIFLLLISTPDFETAASYFSTSNPAFSQAYILRVRALFSSAETSFTALSFRSFRNNFLFC